MGRIAALGACLLAWAWRPPTGVARLDQWHGLILASLWALLCRWQTVSRENRWLWVAGWALPIGLLFRDAYGFAWLWIATWSLVCAACAKLDEDSASVRWAVMLCALAQLPFVTWEWSWASCWPREGAGLAGSLGKRHVLSALFGLCSLWSTGWRAWGWLGCATLTTSLTGVVPAGARLLVDGIARLPRRVRSVAWIGVGLLLVDAAAWAWRGVAPLRSRVEVWTAIFPTLRTPVGFTPLSDHGFLAGDLLDQLLHWQVYHSTLLELWARFGWWALGLMVGVAPWIWRRCGLWVSGWCLVVLGCQSVEAYPALAWMVGMAVIGGRAARREERHGVASISAHGASNRGHPSGLWHPPRPCV